MGDALTERVSDLLFTPVNKDASPWSCNAFILGLALLYFIAFHVTYLTRWTEPKGADKFVEHPRAEWHNSIGSLVSAVLVVACALPCPPRLTFAMLGSAFAETLQLARVHI